MAQAPFTLPLKVTHVTITRLPTGGLDRISFKIEGPTPFPELQAANPQEDYSPYVSVETRRGYAETWLEGMGIDPAKVEILPKPPV